MGLFDKIFSSKEPSSAPQTTKQEKPTPGVEKPVWQDNLIPDKEFGVHLVQLVEMALADAVLTSSERSMLRELALAKGVDIYRFEAYVDRLKEKRGVKEIEDGVIPLKKYNQPTAVTSTLKTMVDMALADGYLSDEERKLILNEASKFGVDLPAFEAGLNAMFMSGDIKKVIDEKFPTTIVKRLVSSEDKPDGKVVETYEEIRTEYRPNTNRGKEREVVKRSTKRIIKVTRDKEMIEDVIDFLCDVDYNLILSALTAVTVISPIAGGTAIALVSTLKGGVEKYKAAGFKRDPKKFCAVVMNEVSVESCLQVLPVAQKYLGDNGNRIINGLLMAHKAYIKK